MIADFGGGCGGGKANPAGWLGNYRAAPLFCRHPPADGLAQDRRGLGYAAPPNLRNLRCNVGRFGRDDRHCAGLRAGGFAGRDQPGVPGNAYCHHLVAGRYPVAIRIRYAGSDAHAHALPAGLCQAHRPPHSPPRTDAEIRATLGASIATEEAQWPSRASAETPTPQPTPTLVPLTTQVTQFARNGGYDIVARVRAGASHKVLVPHDIWTATTVPLPANWDGLVRTSITKVTAYRGALTSDYKLTSPPHLPNVPLDIGAEYIIFIKTSFAKAADDGVCSNQRPVAPTALCYNQAQLNAVGGVGGWYDGRQAWIIDGALARRIPRPHFLSRQPVSDLSAARAAGDSLTLSDLEAAIRQGLRQYRRD